MITTIKARADTLKLTQFAPAEDALNFPETIAQLRRLKTEVNKLYTGKRGLLTLIDNTLVQINLLEQKSHVAIGNSLMAWE